MKLQVLPVLVAILVVFSTPSNGSLETYLDSYIGQITRGPISDATSSTSVTDTAVKYVQSAAIYVGKNADSNFLYVSQNKDDLDSNDSADSNFLPYNPNKASYLIIKTLNWGLWFFTAELSGCEIWIATENGRTPVMFHVNTMNCDYSTEKLQQRENMAVDALNYINEQAGSNIYAFVYRLMAPRSVDAISQYLTGFHSRYPNVVVGRYDGDDGGIFYGETPTQDASDTTVVYAGWSFRCKNTINGQLFNIGVDIAGGGLEKKEKKGITLYATCNCQLSPCSCKSQCGSTL